MASLQAFLYIAPLNKSYTLYQISDAFRLVVWIVMLIDTCRTPIGRLKIKSWVIYVCVAVALCAVPILTIRQFLFQPFSMPTWSMKPTLMGDNRMPSGITEITGDRFMVSKMAYWFHEPQRGDIVVFSTGGIQQFSIPPGEEYLKR